ncbi:MAG: hypothetical protein PHF18_01240 [Methanosarcina sp.]|nr:hypothetical protein [Methanosarcina sp.]MDD3245491.1 hypothetical protein [Methanosarcina sp.]MDD4250542.1 hypothetical protein [Methanosarcina sp.]
MRKILVGSSSLETEPKGEDFREREFTKIVPIIYEMKFAVIPH